MRFFNFHSINQPKGVYFVFCLLFIFIMSGGFEIYAATFPKKPSRGFFVDDTGRFKNAFALHPIKHISSTLFVERKIKVYTVIIESMDHQDFLFLDHYADRLFDEWKLEDDAILFLAEYQNKDAYITLGYDWDCSHIKRAEEVVNSLVKPCFKEGKFLEGILYGIKGMDAIIRGGNLPKRYKWWEHPFFLKKVMPALLIGILLNLLFRYRNSWFWVVIPFLGTFFYFIEWAMRNGGMGGHSTGFGCGGCAGCGDGCGGCSGS